MLSEIENNVALLRDVGAQSRLMVNFRTLILVGFKMPNSLTEATYNDLKWQPKQEMRLLLILVNAVNLLAK